MKEQTGIDKAERTRLRRLLGLQRGCEIRLHTGFHTHEHLWQIAKKQPEDYVPWGQDDRNMRGDCSGGCRWYHVLAGRLGQDWGVCCNPASHRASLLTFEHQGCAQFENDPRLEYLGSPSGRKARERFDDREEQLRQWRKAHSMKTARVTERKVGIFWMVGSRLLFDASPLSEAEPYGDCLTHRNSHIDFWTDQQRLGVVSADIEYEDPPRGRIVYNTKNERFALYADRCILKRKSVVNRIMKSMHLLPDQTDVWPDAHYRCYRCLKVFNG